MGAKRLVELVKRNTMKERGELPDEEGDAVKEFKTMHEEDLWNSWLKGCSGRLFGKLCPSHRGYRCGGKIAKARKP